MSHILYLTAEFEPIQTTGARRPARFVEALLKKGYQVTVLTLDMNSAKLNFPYAKVSNKNPFINRVGYNEVRLSTKKRFYKETVFNRFFFHFIINQDKINVAWNGEVRKFIKENRYHDYNLLVCNIPPFSIALTGIQISKKLGLPMVTDFRDHWAHWGCTPYISRLNYLLVKYYERKVLNHSNKVIGVTQQLVNDLKEFHHMLESDKFSVVPNGFESTVRIPKKLSYQIPKNRKIKIGYVGAFYYNPQAHSAVFKKWYEKKGHRKLQYTPRKENYKYRSPFYFLRAIKRLITVYPEMEGKLDIVFIGDVPGWLKQMVIDFSLEDIVIFKGRLPREETNLVAKEFDWVLTTSLKIENGKDYCLASKSFDYINWGKPTLAFVCNGEQKDFVEKSNFGKVFNPDEDNTEDLFRVLREHQVFDLNQKYLQQFTEVATVAKLDTELKALSRSNFCE